MTKLEISTHEAGHAVVAHVLGQAKYACRIHPEGGGCCGPGDISKPAVKADYTLDNLEPLYKKLSLAELMDDAAISAAGCAAVAMLNCLPIVQLVGCDRTLVEATCRTAFPDIGAEGLRHFDGLALCRARAILSDRWPIVERLAGMLEERGYLSAESIAREVTP
jgi:hypothetical protein